MRKGETCPHCAGELHSGDCKTPSRRDQLLEVLIEHVSVPVVRGPVADALLPLVDHLCAEAAADATSGVRYMAERAQSHGYDLDPDDVLELLDESAAAVNPSKEQQP